MYHTSGLFSPQIAYNFSLQHYYLHNNTKLNKNKKNRKAYKTGALKQREPQFWLG